MPDAEIGVDTALERIAREGFVNVASRLSHEDTVALTGRYGAHNYAPLPVSIVRGEGAYVYDAGGKSYIDCIAAYSAVPFGHCSPVIDSALIAQIRTLDVTGRAVHTPYLALFLQALCEFCGMEAACPMNTGAEAVETAVKIARKWAYTIKGVPENRARIVAADGNFHGRTTTIVGFSSHEQYRRGFGPFDDAFDLAPFGDIDALRDIISPYTAAVLLEPIQAEGGVIVPPPGYLAAVRRLCDETNTLMVLDEVQTGFCRTGKRFAWQHEDAKPDLMCVGKGLGGGLYPVSAALGSREVMDVLTPGDHGSTFGGNPVACAVGVATMLEMSEKALDANAARIGQRIVDGLRRIDSPAITDIRGNGLLIGLEIGSAIDTGELTRSFLTQGIITQLTYHRTFRITPPLTIDSRIADELVDRVEAALAEAARS